MRYKIRRYILYYIVLWGIWIFSIVPERFAVMIGSRIGRIAFWLIPKYRRTTIDNLRSAFGGEKSEKDIRSIGIAVFENLGKSAAEFINFPKLRRTNIQKKVTIENIDTVKRALTRGKGIILITGHFGNWELIGATMRSLGYPGAIIARQIYFKRYDAILNRFRKAADVEAINRDESPKRTLRLLKGNGILGMVADQDIDSVDGVFIDFFGRKAYTPSGPVKLAKASGAALIPCVIVRDGARHRLIFEEPIVLESSGDKERDVTVDTEKWSKVLERYIRQYPEQWVWMHRRWKTQPLTR